MTQRDFLLAIARALHGAGIPYMVAGSHASSHYGQPRATQDADFVIDPTRSQLDLFLDALGPDYYVSRPAAQEALEHRHMFNVIDFSNGWKADFIIRKDRPFSLEEFRRRRPANWQGQQLPIASPEDVILTKLEWDRISPSERQRQDALGVALALGPLLDRSYLRHWAPALGIVDSLEELLRQADALPPPQSS